MSSEGRDRNPDAAPPASNIVVFAWVSFLNDVASEATLRLLPLFLSQVLGAGTIVIGAIEGVAESTATLTKLVSGWISDRLPRRKPLVVAGYAISGLTKPFLLIANHWLFVLFVRFSDRLGKGIRNAPRDALAADSAPPDRRGHSFGLMNALDTIGAFAGLTVALVVVSRGGPRLTRASFDTVVTIAIVPAVGAVVLAFAGLRESARHVSRGSGRAAADFLAGFRRGVLPPTFWRYMAALALFTTACSSDAFLVLKAARTGGLFGLSGTSFVLVCLMGLSLTQALIVVPIGRLSDRIGRKQLILCGWLIYAVAYLGFAISSDAGTLLVLFLFYGAFYGFTEGVERSFIADLVDERHGRGFAYGVFNFVVGVLMFPASLVFGIVAARFGESTAFLADAIAALVAGVALLVTVPEKRR